MDAADHRVGGEVGQVRVEAGGRRLAGHAHRPADLDEGLGPHLLDAALGHGPPDGVGLGDLRPRVHGDDPTNACLPGPARAARPAAGQAWSATSSSEAPVSGSTARAPATDTSRRGVACSSRSGQRGPPPAAGVGVGGPSERHRLVEQGAGVRPRGARGRRRRGPSRRTGPTVWAQVRAAAADRPVPSVRSIRQSGSLSHSRRCMKARVSVLVDGVGRGRLGPEVAGHDLGRRGRATRSGRRRGRSGWRPPGRPRWPAAPRSRAGTRPSPAPRRMAANPARTRSAGVRPGSA